MPVRFHLGAKFFRFLCRLGRPIKSEMACLMSLFPIQYIIKLLYNWHGNMLLPSQFIGRFGGDAALTVIPTLSIASSGVSPCPMRMPVRWFLECILVQVTIRSPMPARPEKVSASAPIVVPQRERSQAMPLVISAALALSPAVARRRFRHRLR